MAKHAARCTDWIAQHELQMRKVYGRDCQGRHGGRLQEMPIDGPLHGGATATPKPRVRVGTAAAAAKEEHGVGGGRGVGGEARGPCAYILVTVPTRRNRDSVLLNGTTKNYVNTSD